MASEEYVSFEYDDNSQEDDEEEEVEEDNKVILRKRVSIVWSYFEKVEKYKVRCRLCNHEQNYQGTTGNILRHLKNKHNIDATLKGQAENPKIQRLSTNMHRIKNQDGESSRIEGGNHQTGNNRITRSSRGRIITYAEDAEIDPYTGDSGQFENYLNLNEDVKPEKTHSVEEQRIIAEIDYFREKAAYYRMQKNLVALQAKKAKFELDQLC